jgi:hypothetical protein
VRNAPACLALAITAFIFVFIAAAADMPSIPTSDQGHLNDVLTVSNYDTGASMTEAYTDTEHLDRDTKVNTGSYDCMSDQSTGGGFLEASINSNVIGHAHIAWQSIDPTPDGKGHHALLGRSIDDLTGVFSIDKFIQLWSGSQPGEISIDWLPCS